MSKQKIEERKYYFKQMIEMAEYDLQSLKLESSIIKEQSNDMELGKTIRGIWNKKEAELKKRIEFLKKELENE